MDGGANLQLAIIAGVIIFSWAMVKLVAWVKTKKINTELWCTVFEGLTQGAVRLDHLKNPESAIEKKSKRDGQDKDFLKAWRKKERKLSKNKPLYPSELLLRYFLLPCPNSLRNINQYREGRIFYRDFMMISGASNA